MSDNEKIAAGLKGWLRDMNDEESKKLKAACAKGYISLHELIDALRKHEIEMERRFYECLKSKS